MTDRTLRFLIAVAIAMLLVFQMGTLISGIFGMAWGIVASLVVAGVSLFSARLAKAGGKSSLWFLLPTMLFTIIPIVSAIWNALVSEASWFDRLVGLTPFLIGFGLPVILLLLVYYELRKRTQNG
jgi:hypothetical protein